MYTKFSPLSLLCLGVMLFCHPAQAAPGARPTAPPSASLQPFLDTHLAKILAPLGAPGFGQPEAIARLKATYVAGMAAAPAERKPPYEAAAALCDALTGAMTERENAVAALRGSATTHSSEIQQPRGNIKQGNLEKKHEDDFFSGSQKNDWAQRAEVLRKDITARFQHERELEAQASAPPPPAVAVASVPGAPPPPAAVNATANGPAQTQDPVVGNWMWPGQRLVVLGADQTAEGARSGTWRLVSATAGGRNYEFKWKRPGLMDSLVLSGDGKTLEGTNEHGMHVVVERK